MPVQLFFALSLASFLLGIAAAAVLFFMPYKRNSFFTPLRCILAGTFLAAVFLFLPAIQFGNGFFGGLKSVLLALHSGMRLFILDIDFDGIAASADTLTNRYIGAGYTLLGAILFVFAPILTFGFVLSFFKNIAAYRDLLLRRAKELAVFSSLSDEALHLAKSIHCEDPCTLIVFTGIGEKAAEPNAALLEDAKSLGAVLLHRDIVDIDWQFFARKRKISLFLMSRQEDENIDRGIQLQERFGALPNFHMFVFASGAESEVFFNAAPKGGMRTRRVNPIRSLINQRLFQDGHSLFENALPTGNDKLISVVLLGLGRFGTEILKALTWFCQMDGYRLVVNVFDRNPLAEEKFAMCCPELMAPERNGTFEHGEAHYTVRIHSGVDVETLQYLNMLKEIGGISHVFVALGDDAANIRAALAARTVLARSGQLPAIHAIVFDSHRRKALGSITDFKEKPYNIDFFGDLESSFAKNAIIASDLEKLALKRHLNWGSEEEFWAYEYNYRSSVASVIHRKARIECKIPGADKKKEDITPEEFDIVQPIEHKRWNAYMRSEGYVFSGSLSKESRNDLAKMHHNLVSNDLLSEKDKWKDLD